MDILDGISDTLIETMPDVSQHAIDEQDAQERKNDANLEGSAPSNENNWPTDKNGTPYNPATHTISPLTGKAIKKKQSGKKSTVAKPKTAIAGAPVQNDGIAEAKATGQFAAGATVAICVGVFGDEFRPRQDKDFDEFAYLTDAYSNYFIVTGRRDVPPAMALCIALASYAIPRFSQPKTQSKLSAMKDWVLSKYLAWRGKKAMKAADKQADKEASR